jgi:hypothetical protein
VQERETGGPHFLEVPEAGRWQEQEPHLPCGNLSGGGRIAAAYTDVKASSFIAGTAGHNTSGLINSSGWRSATLVRHCANSGLPKMIVE